VSARDQLVLLGESGQGSYGQGGMRVGGLLLWRCSSHGIGV
jgi:hypothetical protein